MRTYCQIWLILLLVWTPLGSSATFAYSYEKQRMALEKHLEEKIHVGLSPVVSKSMYVLNVGVKLKPFPEQKARVIQRQKRIPRPQQSATQTELEDLVPLPKVGFWPVNQPRSETEIIEQPEKVIKFDELVESVLIDILVDEAAVTPEQKQSIEEVVQMISRKSSPVSPFVVVKSSKVAFENLQKQNLVESASQEVTQRFKDETNKYLEATKKQSSDVIFGLSGPITYFVIAILLITIAMVLGRRFLHLQEKRLDLDEMISRQNIEAMLKSKEKETVVSGSGGGVASTSGSFMPKDDRFISGVDQLKELSKSDPSAISYLVKKWLHSNDSLSEQALYVATRCLSVDVLDKIRQNLTDTDKKDWNSIIYKMPLKGDLEQVDTYIAHSISSEAVFPIAIADIEVKELIQSISPQEAANCIERNHLLAKLFAHYMPTLKVARILQNLGESSIMDFARNSSQPSTSDVQMLGAKLKEVLGAVRSESNRNDTVFYHIAPDLIREVGLEKETSIYKGLAQMGNVERLVEIAQDFLPGDLVTDLPGEVLGAVLSDMTLTQRAELIFSQEKVRQAVLLNQFGSGRNREILEQELETIAIDTNRAKMLKRGSSKIWGEFVLDVRRFVQSNRDIAQEIQPMIREWASTQVRIAGKGSSRVA